MIRFIVALVALGALFVLTGSWMLWQQTLLSLPSFFYQTLIFVAFSVALVCAYLYKVNKPAIFVQLYLLTMAVKLLAYGAYVVVIILQDRAGAVENVVFFMIAYFVFSALEIGFLYHKISRESKP